MSADPVARALAAQAKALAEAAGGGTPWYWAPPLAADFTDIDGNIDNPTLVDDADVGLLFKVPNHAGGDWRWAVKSIPSAAGDWTYSLRVSTLAVDADGDCIMGIALRDSTDPIRLLLVGVNRNGGFVYQVSEPGSGGSVTSDVSLTKWTGVGEYWFRAQHIASTSKMLYSISVDGKIWTPMIEKNDSDLFDNAPDMIGVGAYYNRTTYPGGLSCSALIAG